MTSHSSEPISQADIAASYDRDGYVFPITVLDSVQASALRTDLEEAEADVAQDAEKLMLLRTYADRLLPSFDALIRHERLLNAVATILGPDLMVWGASLFIKEPQSPKIVSWHQDLTYWGLDDAEETTCWVALSPATVKSGCMKFVAGTHKTKIQPHKDTFSENNLLSRGQEIAVDVDEENATCVELQSGQASMHHGQLFHASGPNHSDDRRIGLAIRYIKPSMQQKSGDRPLVALVAGEDQYDNFTIAESPQRRLTEEDFERCRVDRKIRQRILF